MRGKYKQLQNAVWVLAKQSQQVYTVYSLFCLSYTRNFQYCKWGW